MTDLWNKTVTVYNSIPAVWGQKRMFVRTVLKNCFYRSELTSSSADTTVEKRTSHPRLRIKDVSGYVPPERFYFLVEEQNIKSSRANTIFEETSDEGLKVSVVESSVQQTLYSDKYTLQIGDFIVFGETYIEVTNAAEYAELQQRYRERGFRVTSVSVNIHGLSVDHIAVS